MNEWKDQNGTWQPPDGIHFMREDQTPPYEWHTYRKVFEDQNLVGAAHDDCWCLPGSEPETRTNISGKKNG
jgi:hypothetical protein